MLASKNRPMPGTGTETYFTSNRDHALMEEGFAAV